MMGHWSVVTFAPCLLPLAFLFMHYHLAIVLLQIDFVLNQIPVPSGILTYAKLYSFLITSPHCPQ